MSATRNAQRAVPIMGKSLASLKCGWQTSLHLGFGLLCVRYLVAVFQEVGWLLALPCAAGLVLGWLRPSAALFALILGFCLLSGLEQTVFLFPVALPLATTIWLGLACRRIWSARGTGKEKASAGPRGWADFLVDGLATVTLLHVLAMTVWLLRTEPAVFGRFWNQAYYGWDSPLSYLSLAFLWLHGLFYFRAARQHPESGIFSPSGIKLVFLINSIALLLFFGVQWQWQFPYRWTPGYQSPFNDIGTFGAVAVSLLVFCVSLWRRQSGLRTLGLVLGAIFLALAVAASWSRGTWLAGATFIIVLALVRLPRQGSLLIVASLAGMLVFINLIPRPAAIEERPFLSRLFTLVRFESLQAKAESSGRAGLSHKAWVMVRERPLTGHGIGAFYPKAPRYARVDDPLAAVRTTPHNFFLQLAVEYGLPVALLFTGFMTGLIWQGLRYWMIDSRRTLSGREPPGALPSSSIIALALALTLGTYLQANLTWDIVLLHSPQPFFLWFVAAALSTTLEKARGQSGASSVESG